MKLYKTSYTINDGHQGYMYFGSKKEVNQWKREIKELLENEGEESAFSSIVIEQITVQTSKRGILKALNFHGGHNDNG
jgi:hypothetical protein